MRQKIVSRQGPEPFFEAASIKTESGLAIEEGSDFPLSEVTNTDWFKLLDSDLPKCSKAYDVPFHEVGNTMFLMDAVSLKETVVFVPTDTPHSTRLLIELDDLRP